MGGGGEGLVVKKVGGGCVSECLEDDMMEDPGK